MDAPLYHQTTETSGAQSPRQIASPGAEGGSGQNRLRLPPHRRLLRRSLHGPKAGYRICRRRQKLKLAVTADGSPPLSFQWRKNGQPIAGATGALFTIEKVNVEDAGNYDCVVKNSAGAMTSPPIKLVVRTK
jgi:hypothetical protein